MEDLEYIAAAYEGRVEMLGAIFGTGEKKSDDTPSPAAPSRARSRPRLLTPGAFDRMFLSGNDNE